MSENPPSETTVEELYTEFAAGPSDGRTEALLEHSLEPRGPDMLFDIAAELGVNVDDLVLDAGCRDGRHMTELVNRFGCRAVGVELVEANLRRRAEVIAATGADVSQRLSFVRGDIQRLPFQDGTFDLVWNRDVMIHVPDLRAGFSECRRVLRVGRRMLLFQMFATRELSEAEAARLWPPLAAVPANADPDHFERCVLEAGWTIERVEHLQSEWREHAEEEGSGRTSRQLLHAARLLRRPGHYVETIGRTAYEGELANTLWGVYQMIGKLSPRVYVLRSVRHPLAE
ncbi:MAG: class I SAM-dependent methyltransferase [Actinomycetota bacterium]|nr:class I SAM-dependent methyltransferase [Actinomycetota bacterium]